MEQLRRWFSKRTERKSPPFDDLGTADLRRATAEYKARSDRRITRDDYHDAVCKAALDIPEIRDHPEVAAYFARVAQYQEDEAAREQ